MNRLFKNGEIYLNGQFVEKDFILDNSGIIIFAEQMDVEDEMDEVIDCTGLTIMPGFVDTHVHLRSPGFEEKETIAAGTKAAAHGGYTTVFAMPNLNPVPDTLEHLAEEEKIIAKEAVIPVFPVCALTKDRNGKNGLSDIEELSTHSYVFSDDGSGIEDAELMKQAMERIKAVNGILSEHCEVQALVPEGASLQEGKTAEKYGVPGIPSSSEYEEVIRDIALAKETGCDFHVCHISAAESVEAVRQAKKEGLSVTCEVTPHHLLLSEDDITENDGRFKMNPPLRTEKDRLALIEGIKDGTIDMIATDHAPHTAQEKNTDILHAKMGVAGLETAFAACYTGLVRTGAITLEKLVDLMSTKPAEVFGIEKGEIHNLAPADFCIFDLNRKYRVDPSQFLSKGRSTPFEGKMLQGVCVMTVSDGKIVYRGRNYEA